MTPVKSKVLYDLQYELGLQDAVNSCILKQVWYDIQEPITQHVDHHVLSTIWGTVKNKSKMR